jgi:hypothetical protein
MAANRDMIDPAVEAMMMRSPFGGLAPDEQRLVLETLGTPELYERMRTAIIASRGALAEAPPSLVPRAATLDSLHGAIASRRRKPAPARRFSLGALFTRPVPLYQPAAVFAMLAIVVGVYLLGRESGGSGVRERIVYVERPAAPVAAPMVGLDTEAIVQRVVDSIKGEIARAIPVQASGASARGRNRERRPRRGEWVDTSMNVAHYKPEQAMEEEGNRFVGLGNLPGLDRQRRGKSIAEDSTIGRFRSKMVPARL